MSDPKVMEASLRVLLSDAVRPALERASAQWSRAQVLEALRQCADEWAADEAFAETKRGNFFALPSVGSWAQRHVPSPADKVSKAPAEVGREKAPAVRLEQLPSVSAWMITARFAPWTAVAGTSPSGPPSAAPATVTPKKTEVKMAAPLQGEQRNLAAPDLATPPPKNKTSKELLSSEKHPNVAQQLMQIPRVLKFSAQASPWEPMPMPSLLRSRSSSPVKAKLPKQPGVPAPQKAAKVSEADLQASMRKAQQAAMARAREEKEQAQGLPDQDIQRRFHEASMAAVAMRGSGAGSIEERILRARKEAVGRENHNTYVLSGQMGVDWSKQLRANGLSLWQARGEEGTCWGAGGCPNSSGWAAPGDQQWWPSQWYGQHTNQRGSPDASAQWNQPGSQGVSDYGGGPHLNDVALGHPSGNQAMQWYRPS